MSVGERQMHDIHPAPHAIIASARRRLATIRRDGAARREAHLLTGARRRRRPARPCRKMVDAERQARRAGEQDPGLAQYPRLPIRQPEIADPDIAPPPRIPQRLPQRPRHRQEFRVGLGHDRDPGRCPLGHAVDPDLGRVRKSKFEDAVPNLNASAAWRRKINLGGG